PDSNRLVVLQGLDSLRNPVPVVSSGNWLDWKREARTIAFTALHLEKRYAVLDQDGPTRVPTDLVSGDFFSVLRAPFVAGRPFTDQEVVARERVAVVSETFWRRALAGDFGLRRTLEVEGVTYRVVGAVKAGHEFPAGTELWLPVHFEPEHGAMRNNINWVAIARLRDGVAAAQAETDLSGIALRIHREEPEALYSYGVVVTPLLSSIVGDASTYLRLLMAAVVLVLLIACTNLAAGQLARGLVRVRETAVRAALGAGQRRLAQQVLVE